MMTIIAGIWRFGTAGDSSADCAAMLRAQCRYGPNAPIVEGSGGLAFGQASFAISSYMDDSGPFLGSPRGRPDVSLLVADARLDNREEILDRIGLARDSAVSDPHLLQLAWLHSKAACLDWLLGDFAFAVWDEKEQALLLGRDAMGQRPLHYFRGEGFVAFASMPPGLQALDEVGDGIDETELARFIADIPRTGPSTYFTGLRRVEPGHLVRITRSGLISSDYWRLPDREIHYPRSEDYFEALREQLDRATRSRLRRESGRVGAHLSAGLDSNAVAATAARLLSGSGERLLALTSAPRPGFKGPVPDGRVADESGYAAATAQLHPNIDHRVIRPAGLSPIEILRRDSLDFQEPLGVPCNHVWWTQINQDAMDMGVSVMLTGESGNLTFSAGTPAMLADLVREGHWGRWLVQARSSLRSGIRLRGLLALSFGPFFPRRIWSLAARMASRAPTSDSGVSLLHPEWARRLDAEALELGRGRRPEGSNRTYRWNLLRAQDPGASRKETLARWGLEERDPTADRRLAEFCFALPPEQYFADGMRRRLARLALRDRLPSKVIDAPRGYQFADWYETIGSEDLQSEIDWVEQTPIASSLLDLPRLRRLADDWPPGDWGSVRTIGMWRIALLRALAAARFSARKPS